MVADSNSSGLRIFMKNYHTLVLFLFRLFCIFPASLNFSSGSALGTVCLLFYHQSDEPHHSPPPPPDPCPLLSVITPAVQGPLEKILRASILAGCQCTSIQYSTGCAGHDVGLRNSTEQYSSFSKEFASHRKKC